MRGHAGDASTLLRATTVATCLIGAYIGSYGRTYLELVLRPFVEQVFALAQTAAAAGASAPFEVRPTGAGVDWWLTWLCVQLDPLKLRPGEDLALKQQELRDTAGGLLAELVRTLPQMPMYRVSVCGSVS
jgi:hypothetical protein